jgi:hypothetical protein
MSEGSIKIFNLINFLNGVSFNYTAYQTGYPNALLICSPAGDFIHSATLSSFVACARSQAIDTTSCITPCTSWLKGTPVFNSAASSSQASAHLLKKMSNSFTGILIRIFIRQHYVCDIQRQRKNDGQKDRFESWRGATAEPPSSISIAYMRFRSEQS